jgi:hypothetical protein
VPIFTKRPAAQDEFLDRGLDPPHRIGREAEAAIGIEFLHTLHQADVPFGNQLGHRQTVAAIAHRDLGNETQVAGHQLRSRLGITMFLIPLGKHVFLLCGQERELADFRQIAVEAGFTRQRGDTQRLVLFTHQTMSFQQRRFAGAYDP